LDHLQSAVPESEKGPLSIDVQTTPTKQPSATASAVITSLSSSETSDGSSSFVKDGFDQSDLDSLEAEIARELQADD